MNKQIKMLGAVAVGAILACQVHAASPGEEQVTFPEIGTEWLKGGTFVNVENLRQVAPGLDKDQLYDLLGRPHFKTGMFSVKEWDYLFNFRTGKGAEFISCQFKVLFDDNYKAKSYYWKDPACAAVLAPPAPVKPQPTSSRTPAPEPVKLVTLSADGLFRFDGSSLADLLPEGESKVRALAQDIRRNLRTVKSITVTGHTDRLGSHEYNQALSQARAETVRQLLAQAGVNASAVRALGVGESEPLVSCSHSLPRTSLVSCLQPNRRVEIKVIGE